MRDRTAAVKEPRCRPIPFTALSIEAIFAGTKTQTRRIISLDLGQKTHSPFLGADGIWRWMTGRVSYAGDETKCIYGQAGDRLWVKETWYPAYRRQSETTGASAGVIYKADYGSPRRPDLVRDYSPGDVKARGGGWKSPRFMPRWASRLTLDLTNVRAQRLWDIDDADARAEGVFYDGTWWLGRAHPVKGTPKCFPSPESAYRSLWEEMHGEKSWEANPWVWALSFRVVA